jgi:hypothetical protein
MGVDRGGLKSALTALDKKLGGTWEHQMADHFLSGRMLDAELELIHDTNTSVPVSAIGTVFDDAEGNVIHMETLASAALKWENAAWLAWFQRRSSRAIDHMKYAVLIAAANGLQKGEGERPVASLRWMNNHKDAIAMSEKPSPYEAPLGHSDPRLVACKVRSFCYILQQPSVHRQTANLTPSGEVQLGRELLNETISVLGPLHEGSIWTQLYLAVAMQRAEMAAEADAEFALVQEAIARSQSKNSHLQLVAHTWFARCKFSQEDWEGTSDRMDTAMRLIIGGGTAIPGRVCNHMARQIEQMLNSMESEVTDIDFDDLVRLLGECKASIAKRSSNSQ